MKRSIFIIIGIIIVLILLAVWIYVLFFGNPKNLEEAFNRFGFGDTTDTTIIEEPIIEEEENPVVDVNSEEKLRQLTTKPVIGYQEVRFSTTSKPTIYFVEAGTGHIFSIDLNSGEEKRVSGTTIPNSYNAAITPNGEYVIIQSGSGSSKKNTLGKIENGSLSSVVLNENINNLKASLDNTFLYYSKTSFSSVGKEFFPISNVYETLFTVPFRETTVVWGNTKGNSHYIYPKTAGRLEGFLYKSTNGTLTRTPVDGFGLSAIANDENIIFSKNNNGDYRSYVNKSDSINHLTSPINVLPEKCTFDRTIIYTAYCAQSVGEFNESYPDTWYAGEVTFADKIWKVNLNSLGASILIDTQRTTGRNLDIININNSGDGNNLYFQNKLDNSLWLFELN